jgi:hypothetical protein
VKRLLVLFSGAVLSVALIAQAPVAQSKGHDVLEFSTMAPVTGPYVGATNPIRGISGGGLPWQIASGSGELSVGGHLEVEVAGLVLLDGAPVPEANRGINPIATFRAIVSCQTITDGLATVANVSTGPFPASMTGNSKIEAAVSLPTPCIAPIVFVGPATSATLVWFAATGQ